MPDESHRPARSPKKTVPRKALDELEAGGSDTNPPPINKPGLGEVKPGTPSSKGSDTNPSGGTKTGLAED